MPLLSMVFPLIRSTRSSAILVVPRSTARPYDFSEVSPPSILITSSSLTATVISQELLRMTWGISFNTSRSMRPAVTSYPDLQSVLDPLKI